VRGCSCGGKYKSHQCLHLLPLPLPLTTQTSSKLTEALSPYFAELKLADIVYGYLDSVIKPFISTWRVSNQIKLPLQRSDAKIDFFVQWGDGTGNRITSYNQAEVTHHYTNAGDYTIHIDGLISGFAFGQFNTSCRSILDISQWGCVGLGNEGMQFYCCSYLNVSAVDEPDLSKVTNLAYMFLHASRFNGDISKWDTSNVTNMNGMFKGVPLINRDSISNWDLRRVPRANRAKMFR